MSNNEEIPKWERPEIKRRNHYIALAAIAFAVVFFWPRSKPELPPHMMRPPAQAQAQSKSQVSPELLLQRDDYLLKKIEHLEERVRLIDGKQAYSVP